MLAEVVQAARDALGDHLRSAVLFGSAAEDRLRATSDVNLLLLLSEFEPARVDALRPALRNARSAVALSAMFLLESELPAAVESFPVKFADIVRRHRVLHGPDPFTGLAPSRGALLARVRQELFNHAIRLREIYAVRGLREEQATLAVAESAGPLRTCAAALLDLRGTPAASPREALLRFAAELPQHEDTVLQISRAREEGKLPPGRASAVLADVAALARALHALALELPA